jgi:hypothetical protein
MVSCSADICLLLRYAVGFRFRNAYCARILCPVAAQSLYATVVDTSEMRGDLSAALFDALNTVTDLHMKEF